MYYASKFLHSFLIVVIVLLSNSLSPDYYRSPYNLLTLLLLISLSIFPKHLSIEQVNLYLLTFNE